MPRTTIVAPPELLARLRHVAADRNTSMARLIREALEEKVRDHRPRPRSIGIGASRRSETARDLGGKRTPPRSWR
ncbi:MAG: ribbon-helix-helix protein, CopG family [Chloroflexota bacterium]|nr:ribbon-helix-helix protein, CopG family [Chloroflexota bacterium]